MSRDITRRRVLRFSLAGVGAGLTISAVKPLDAFGARVAERKAARASSGYEPAFLLQILFRGGLDASNLLDARPLAFRAAGLWQNPFGEEPFLLRGRNGGSTLATRAARPLLRVRDDVSIVNGIIMSTSFDGHEQNEGVWLTCDPAGGAALAADVGAALRARSLGASSTPGSGAFHFDWVRQGPFSGVPISNDGNAVNLNLPSLRDLHDAFREGPADEGEGPGVRAARARMRALATGAGNGTGGVAGSVGALGRAARDMNAGLQGARALREAIARIEGLPEEPDTPGGGGGNDPDATAAVLVRQCESGAAMAIALFRAGLTPCVTLELFADIDAHDADTASKQPILAQAVAEGVTRVIERLKETRLDQTRSFLDVTTFVAGSEFSRTARQAGVPIESTGTDHNALSNSVFLAGRGVRGGLVVGASDAAVLEGNAFADISGAHRNFDPSVLKAMGRPFDFDRCAPRDDRPDAFVLADHLTWVNVANTVLSACGLPASAHRDLDRFGTRARVIGDLLT